MKTRLPLLAAVLVTLAAACPIRGAAQAAMNMEQTISDQAQRMTLAFDGLAFLTGSLGADSFLPPGKVADFSGFQYLRDNDPTGLGHNTDFVTIIARNVLSILSADQVTQLVRRAEDQLSLINQYGMMRFPLMQAFRRRLTGDMPAGRTELDWAAVARYSADLYAVDGLISLDRAQLFGDILRGMSTAQKAALDHLTTLRGVGNWNQTLADPLDGLHLSPDVSVGVMTYASEMYSWYAGSVEADTYFCPERQGTYFGSFYLKDAPAMGNPNYSIDTNLTADSGDAFLAILNPAQQGLITNLVAIQKPYLLDLVNTRSNISSRLRGLMTSNVIDTNAVMALCRRYGELDGMIVYSIATAFSRVGQSLTTNQQAQLFAKRTALLGANLLYPAGAYLYSAPSAMPAITNTDFLFAFTATDRMPLEDSGQSQGFTPVFGEDADYTIAAPSFTTTNGIVSDAITGRMWQQADGGEMTWEAAQAYAASLTLGGYSDWRLPTAHELFSIVNHGRSNPAIDPSVFAATAAEYWWSQDRQSGNATNVWVANAGGGIGAHPRDETLSAGGSKRFHVRCVRGAPTPGEFGLRHHFINNVDGTVTDLDTGLVWQQAPASQPMNWADALAYADTLSVAGHTDWRLPNIKELQSLNDETLANPSLDSQVFMGGIAFTHWSSTTLVNQTNAAWFVDFQLGLVSYDSKLTNLMVRCVRGGGTQATVAAGATPVRLLAGLGFTEGPAADSTGQVFFSDVTASTIYRWSLDGELTAVRSNTGGANGLAFDGSGNLVACEGANGRITSMSPAGSVMVLADGFNGVRFNEPNDLWIDPGGSVYFTDPVYFNREVPQGGEHVYYLQHGSSNAVRVAENLTRPNGLVGTPDGRSLYVADWGASKVYRYDIQPDGALAGQSLFAPVRCDGMTIDSSGRLYLCENVIRVFDASGAEVDRITVPERPTNVEFGGARRQFLFITTDGGSLYSVRMSSRGGTASVASNAPPSIGAVSLSPAAPAATDPVWIAARVADDWGIASVQLTWSLGSVQAATNVVFLETMGAAETKPWDGTGTSNAWTVTWNGANPFEQRGGANYGPGNTNGLEFKLGTTNLADSSITTTRTVDARGGSGQAEFWLWSDGLAGSMGWTFQIGTGGAFTTRLSELSGTNHGWQRYTCALQPQDLVSNLAIRFQFRGGAGDPRIDVDQISIRISQSGAVSSTVTMLDDGAHQDGAAGDGVYGGAIPALPAGTSVSYFITAADGSGATATSPAAAPGSTWSYTVGSPLLDSVGDGIPDSWRARYFGGTGASTNSNSCASADPDGDGVPNAGEYLADTNPASPLSYLCIQGIKVGSGASVYFQSSPNRVYTLQYSMNVASGAWSNVATQTDVAGTGGIDVLVDPTKGGSARYYRLGVKLPSR